MKENNKNQKPLMHQDHPRPSAPGEGGGPFGRWGKRASAPGARVRSAARGEPEPLREPEPPGERPLLRGHPGACSPFYPAPV